MFKKSINIQLKLVIFGIFLGLVILEIFLQLFSLSAQYVTKEKQIFFINNNLRILCLGDSFTYGLGSADKQDYPSQLQKLLNQDHRNITVINQGVPGMNSSRLAQKIPEVIKEIDPKIIFLMIGVNDFWNFEGTRYSDIQNAAIFYNQLCKIKTCKLFALIYYNIKQQHESDLKSLAKKQYWPYLKNDHNYHKLILLANYFDENKQYHQARRYCLKSILDYPHLALGYITLSRHYKQIDKLPEAISILKKSLKYVYSNQVPYIYKELIELSRYLRDKKQYELALQPLLAARYTNYLNQLTYAELRCLFEEWKDLITAVNVYHYLDSLFPNDYIINCKLGEMYKALRDYENAKIYFLKTLSIDPNNALVKQEIKNANFFIDLKQTKTCDISLGYNNFLEDLNDARLDYVQNSNNISNLAGVPVTSSDNIESIYKKNLFTIYSECKKKGVLLILLSYPAYLPDSLLMISQDFNIPLIDLCPEFSSIDNKSDYFTFDGHCTAKGDELIAQIIYKNIKKVMVINNDDLY